jgi:hypothetical protein
MKHDRSKTFRQRGGIGLAFLGAVLLLAMGLKGGQDPGESFPWDGPWRGVLPSGALKEINLHLPLQENSIFIGGERATFSVSELRRLGLGKVTVYPSWSKDEILAGREVGTWLWFSRGVPHAGSRVDFVIVSDSAKNSSGYGFLHGGLFEDVKQFDSQPAPDLPEQKTIPSQPVESFSSGGLQEIAKILGARGWPVFLGGADAEFAMDELSQIDCVDLSVYIGWNREEFLQAREDGLWLWLSQSSPAAGIRVDFVYVVESIVLGFGHGYYRNEAFAIVEQNILDF